MSVAVEEGQYVRVVLEGPVMYSDGGSYFDLGRSYADANSITYAAEHVKSIEVIPEPEAWRYGDVVVDAEGDVFKRILLFAGACDDQLPWRGLSGRNQAEYYPTRPLTLLVRGNKAVNNG